MARRSLCLLLVVAVVTLCLLVHVSDAQSRKKGKMGKSPKRRTNAIVKDLEKNVSALWDEVEMLSQPVHVHLHGDSHMMDRHDYDHDHDHDRHGHRERETHGHDDDEHRHHKHDDDDAAGHRDHKHGHKKHKHHHKKHDDKMEKKKGHAGHAHDAMQTANHSHMHEEEDHDDMHHGRRATHVHIHLHTGMEEEQQEEEKKLFDLPPQEYRYARCDMVGNSALPLAERQNIRGTVFFRQMPGEEMEVQLNLQGFTIDHKAEGEHGHLRGLHGHTYGDMSEGCKHQGGHYNPGGVNHGGPGDHTKHPGDFGNLKIEEDGTVMTYFKDTHASLFGPESMLGRGLLIHEGEDDLGKGGDAGSLRSGNAGARIACCSIVACGEPVGIWSD